ncbi:MAG: hypothetical protein H7196_03600 [candidate division SR1 bacterium]|nr:hypothetical protein [candidate division SR1 bacterium]
MYANKKYIKWDKNYVNLFTDKAILIFSSNSSFYYRCDIEKGFYQEIYKPKFDLKTSWIDSIKEYQEIKSRVKELTYDAIFDGRNNYKFTNIFNIG